MPYDAPFKGAEVDSAVEKATDDGHYYFRNGSRATPSEGHWRLDATGDYVKFQRYTSGAWDSRLEMFEDYLQIANTSGGVLFNVERVISGFATKAQFVTSSGRQRFNWQDIIGTGEAGGDYFIDTASGGDLTGSRRFIVRGTTGDVEVESDTPSTSPTNGAFIVGGGVGIAGQLSLGGELSYGANNVIVRSTGDEINIAGPSGIRALCIAIGADANDSGGSIAIGFGSIVKHSNRTQYSTVTGDYAGATNSSGASLGPMTLYGYSMKASENATSAPLGLGYNSLVDADNAGVIGNGITNSVANRIHIGKTNQHVYIPGGIVRAAAAYDYFGEPGVDGSWRVGRSGGVLSFEKRVSGSWVVQYTSDSVTESAATYSADSTLTQRSKQYAGLLPTTAGASITLDLPASPSEGDEVWFKDHEDGASTNNVVFSGNGNSIDGSGTYTVNQDGESGILKFSNGDWRVF